MKRGVIAILVALPWTPRAAIADGVLFVLDVPGSMSQRDREYFTLFDAVLARPNVLITAEEARGNEMGLLVFSHREQGCDDVELAVPVAKNTSYLIRVRTLELRPKGPTPLGAALKEARKYLEEEGLRLVRVVVLTDGV